MLCVLTLQVPICIMVEYSGNDDLLMLLRTHILMQVVIYLSKIAGFTTNLFNRILDNIPYHLHTIRLA